MGNSLLLVLLLFFMFHFNSLLTSSSPSNAHPISPFLCHPLQSHALLQFKSSFSIYISASQLCGDISYPKTESWKEGTDCCTSWDGVTCNEDTGHVIELDLSCSQLEGNIHSNNSLFSPHFPPYLQKLNLAHNEFLGSNMSSLFGVKFGSSLTHLNLSFSDFSGNIPSEISHLSNLVSLDLSMCRFSGNIPSEISHLSNLVFLDLSFNLDLNAFLIVKSDRVLERIARNLTQLRVLNLDRVDMSSVEQASSSLMNLSSSLTSLSLRGCQLQGQLPFSLLLRPNLQELSLLYNNFIPITFLPVFNSITPSNNLTVLGLNDIDLSLVSIGFLDFVGNLESLRSLYLRNCSLGGSLLQSLGNLTKLTTLALPANNLSGPIPASFCNMTQLFDLYLGDNQLNGMLPSCLFAMPSLENLRLNDNKLYGHIPTSLLKSVNLTLLDISSNNFSGSFDLHMLLDLKKVQYLDFHSNMLQGKLPIPPSTTMFFSVANNSFTGEISSFICNQTSLQLLDLSHNRLIGLIPQCLGNLSELSLLDLGANNLHGTVPNMFAKGNHLHYLNFNANQLRGRLPPSLSYCQYLEFLDVGDNLIEDTFPHWLEILSLLQVLVLRSNKFFGSINGFRSTSPFSSLRILDVQNNNLSGQLPTRLISNLKAMMNVHQGIGNNDGYMTSTYFSYYSMVLTVKGIEMKYEKILTAMTTLDFSRNKFEGHIPEVIGKLRSLKSLNLSHNLLTGHIPPSIGDLADLEGLDLSSNKLVGEIPKELVNLGFLEFLSLSHNQLEGPIPRGPQLSTIGNVSYEDNLGLCGFPLSKVCKAPSPKNVDSLDSASGFSWEGAIVGYGCGIVFGVYMGYLMFSTRSPLWVMRMMEGMRQRGKSVKRSKRNGRKRGGRRS